VKRQGQGGFTLLEIAVALAILGAGVVTCLQVFSGSLRLQSRASRQTRVVLLARAAMDDLMVRHELENFTVTLPTDTQGFTVVKDVGDAGAEDGIVVPEGIEPDDLPVSPKRLVVQVTWNDGSGDKTYMLRTVRLVPSLAE
jgi:prepilin-type N-terminal cleavage/methylation domain-containing protein